MKKYRNLSWLAYFIVTTVIIFLLSSCQKKLDSLNTPKEAGVLVFSVSGITNPTDKITKIAGVNNKTEKKGTDSIIEFDDQFLLLTKSSTDAINAILPPNNEIEGKSNTNTKLASQTPLATGKKYRLIIINNTTNQIVHNVVATADTELTLTVPINQTYKWIAFSYNDNTTPTFDVNNRSAETYIDKDFLYVNSGSNHISTNAVTPPIYILFEHKVALVSLAVDANVIGGTLDSVKAQYAQNDYFKTATINLNDGSASNVTPVNITEVLFPVSLSHPNKRMTKDIYTADPTNLTQIQVDLEKIFVTPHGATGQRELVSERPAGQRSVAFNFTNPTVGQRLSGSFHIISPLKAINLLHHNNFVTDAGILQVGTLGLPPYVAYPRHINSGNDFYLYNIYDYEGFPALLIHNFPYVEGFPPAPIPNWEYGQNPPGTTNYPPNKYHVPYVPGSGRIPVKGAINSYQFQRNYSDPYLKGYYQANLTGQARQTIAPDPRYKDLTVAPDVFINQFHERSGDMNQDDVNALNQYLNDKGVVILLAGDLTNKPFLKSFLTAHFAKPNTEIESKIVYTRNVGPGEPGYILTDAYRFRPVNDEITNGFFGDLRNKFWGPGGYYYSNDPNYYILPYADYYENVDPSKAINYSYAIPENPYSKEHGPQIVLDPDNAWMIFRSRTKNLIVIADDNFAVGSDGHWDNQNIHNHGTFRLDDTFFPTPLTSSINPKLIDPGYELYNSTLMANIMLWAFRQASYGGILHN